MQLTVREAAQLLRVSEKSVYRWVADRGLPAHRVGDQYRFNRAELLEWVIANRVNASPHLFEEPDASPTSLPQLADALEAGGVHYRVEGDDRDSVLRSVAHTVRLPEGTDPAFLFEVLRARELLGSTAVGDGIAIPHPRHPLVLHVTKPSVALCFLEKPIDYGALDRKPVATLFLILSPTVREHLHLLSRLAFALQQDGFRGAVMRQAARQEILREARSSDELADASRTAAATPP
jgi:PTS system nitrogen regulatory IIA component